MSLFSEILSGGLLAKTVDATLEGLYEGLFDKPDPVDELEAGDIIGIRRPLGYEHYAVYIGGSKVIHYAAESGNFGEATVHEAPIEDFLDGQQTFFVLDFDEVGKHPTKQRKGWSALSIDPLGRAFDELGCCIPDHDIEHIYSSQETVARAWSLCGENKYSLVFNNCEHFAIWCKTGARKSYQVERVIGGTSPLPLLTMKA